MFVLIFPIALALFPLTIIAIEPFPQRLARRITAFILGGLVLALLASCLWLGSLGERGLLSSAEGLVILFSSQIVAVGIGRALASRRRTAEEARMKAKRDRT